VPSGIAVKAASERSQHANKRLARELLAIKLAAQRSQGQAQRLRSQQHWEVERGRAVKVFRL
jgi:peptide chain release factor